MAKFQFVGGGNKRGRSRSCPQSTLTPKPITGESVVQLVDQLPVLCKERLRLLQQNKGKTIRELDGMVDLGSSELDIANTTKKGAAGKWVEHFILGHRGDTIAKPDLGDLEIKTHEVRVVEGKFKHLETQRLTKISFNGIQTQPFEGSPLQHKAVMLVILTSEASMAGDKIILEVGYIDLRPHMEQVALDYEVVRQACKKGLAHTLDSRQDQMGKLVKTYNCGSGDNEETYLDEQKQRCTAKGKSFRLFKAQLEELFQVLPTIEQSLVESRLVEILPQPVELGLPSNPIQEQPDEQIALSETEAP